MTKYQTDPRLWGLASVGLFLSVAAIWAIFEGFRSITFPDLVAMVATCTVVGWVIHAFFVMCGISLSDSTQCSESSDYDEVNKADGENSDVAR